jgi:heat-inducible transcriptional repressor
MADLIDEGYLSQPHTSAGRVPTEKAFRLFVREINVRRPSAAELARVRTEFTGVGNLTDGVGHSSHVLTELTRNVGITAVIPTSSQVLDQVELLPLADRRVLVVVVTHDRMVRNRVVTLDEEVSPDELISIRNYLNHHFSGWVLSEARQELERRLQLQSAYYDTLLKRLSAFHNRGLLDIDLHPEVHLEGASYLVELDLHLTRNKMRELLHALEEKKRILQLLDRFLERPLGEVGVQVGLGDLHPTMKELSLIGITVTTAGGMTAKIAVLGPMRMRYEKVMSTVLQVGRTLQTLPS